VPVPLSQHDTQQPDSILNHAAYAEGLDEDFVHSVAKVESGLRQTAVSKKGAIGLMQLMPSTAAELGVDPTRAPDNAQGGAMYLRDLLIRYRGNSALALAAYNAGPGAVARFGGVPPYEETRRYVVLVLREYGRRLHARKTTLARQIAPNPIVSRNTASNRPTATN
jgi:soluble lytic murein transglycosylase-like protein